MTPLLVRRYRRDDRQACLALFEGNIPDSFFPHEIPKFMEFLDCFCGPYLVVEESGNLVGCGGLADHPDDLTLCWGMVARTRQRQGVGRLLLQVRLALADRIPGGRLVRLNTSQRTAPFFEKEGFVTRLVSPNGYGPGLDRHDMELRLGPAARQKIAAYAPAWQAAGHCVEMRA